MILPAFAAHLKFWGTNTAHPGTWSAFVINRSLIRMAKVLQTTFWDAFYRRKSCDLIQILLKFDVKDPIDNKSVLVQVMAWCRQASSHCLNQCRHRFMTSYGVSLGCNELTPCCLGQGGVCDITDDNVLSILWQDSISFDDCFWHNFAKICLYPKPWLTDATCIYAFFRLRKVKLETLSIFWWINSSTSFLYWQCLGF